MLVWLLAVFLCWPAGAATANPSAPGSTVDEPPNWERVLGAASDYVRRTQYSEQRHQALSTDLDRVIKDARRAAEQARQQEEEFKRLQTALGPPPKEGETEEEDVAQRRTALSADVNRQRAQLAKAELTVARAEELQAKLAAIQRGQLISLLSERWASPLKEATISAAVTEFAVLLSSIVSLVADWSDNLTREKVQSLWWNWRGLILVAALIGGVLLRRFLLRHYGPDPSIDQPSYSRRLAAALATASGHGLLPAALLLGLYARTRLDDSLFAGPAAQLLASLFLALTFVVIAHAATQAVLRPDLPEWRLTSLAPGAAKKLYGRILFLAVILSSDHFVRNSGLVATASDDLKSFYGLLVVGLEAVGLLLLTHASVWKTQRHKAAEENTDRAIKEEAANEDEREATETASASINLWQVGRHLLAFVSVAGLVAFGIGYTRLGYFLIDNLILTIAVVGGLYLLRRLFYDLIDLLPDRLTQTEHRGLPRILGLQSLRMWTTAVVDLLLVVAGVYLVATSWGLPRNEISRWLGTLLSGFRIGGVTISFIDIGLAIAVFIAAQVVTRFVRARLAERVLPSTNLDLGVRDSIATGVGYLGAVIAFLLAVSVLGIGLSNIAIVAGALSVGIGFGLQNIVNNFVSGLILLVERPIKVGDWVVLGNQEGTVRRISVRATEIETFQRASVIVPNSEILSTALVNWTHRDKGGRVDIPVGIAYGSDTKKARDLLLACAEAHPEVARWPRPFVLFRDFGDSALTFELRAYLRDVNRRLSVASDLRFAIADALRRGGIEIPFPQRVFHLAKDSRFHVDVQSDSRHPADPGATPPSPVMATNAADVSAVLADSLEPVEAAPSPGIPPSPASRRSRLADPHPPAPSPRRR